MISMSKTRIPLSQIRVENKFRKEEKEDHSLILSIKSQGLLQPLIVEKEAKNQYVLVEGYRRYRCLAYLKLTHAHCVIHPKTSEEKRVVKRLTSEFHRDRLTAYEFARMISFLLDRGYTTPQIASECNVTHATIAKYVKGQSVPDDWIEEAEKTGAGKHGLTEIWELKNTLMDNILYIRDKYIARLISAKDVEAVKRVTKIHEYGELPQEAQKKCIDEITDKQQLKTHHYDIIYEESLKHRYTEIAHEHVFKLINFLLNKIDDNIHPNFVDHLKIHKKRQLNEKLNEIAKKLGIPYNWSVPSDEMNKKNKPLNDGVIITFRDPKNDKDKKRKRAD